MAEFEFGPNQTKWLAALESGTFRQATGVLYSPNEGGFCCLGVAREVCGFNEFSSTSLQNSYREMGLHTPDGGFNVDLNPAVRAEIVATVSHGEEFLGGTYTLTAMNDSRQWSFRQIADFIRKFPETIFTGPK